MWILLVGCASALVLGLLAIGYTSDLLRSSELRHPTVIGGGVLLAVAITFLCLLFSWLRHSEALLSLEIYKTSVALAKLARGESSGLEPPVDPTKTSGSWGEPPVGPTKTSGSSAEDLRQRRLLELRIAQAEAVLELAKHSDDGLLRIPYIFSPLSKHVDVDAKQVADRAGAASLQDAPRNPGTP